VAPPANVRWVGSPYSSHVEDFEPIAIVVHTMVGTLKGVDKYFQYNAPKVSSHFGIGLKGEPISQYVSLDRAAHANGIFGAGSKWLNRFGADWPNGRSISIETDDSTGYFDHKAPVTEDQYQDTLTASRLAVARHPTIEYVTGHFAIDPINKSGCPGARWVASGKLARLANDLDLELFI